MPGSADLSFAAGGSFPLAAPRIVLLTVVREHHMSPPPPQAPPLPRWPQARPRLRPAPRREVLHDEQGRLYEREGDLIRPIHAPKAPATTVAEPQPETPAPTVKQEHVCKRLLRFGDWMEQIKPQLADPGRLQPDHMLPCEVRITAPDPDQKDALPLNDAHSAKLKLPPPRAPMQFRIVACADPTVALKQEPEPPPAIAPQAKVQRLVPDRYVRPWEFVYSREDALAQMKRDQDGGWSQRFHEFLGRRDLARAIDRWLGELKGKDASAQLWAVRPPGGGYQHGTVREWLEHTLETLGEDPYRAAREWEIFWRRKGV
jgi:hypothetical protein